MYLVPEAAIKFGFSNGPGGAHDSRTIMVSELRQVLDAVPGDASYQDYAQAIIEDNVLGKRSVVTRTSTLRRLRQLYGLSPDLLLFQVMRTLWAANAHSQPMLAFLCASARDPLLRVTVPAILQTLPGEPVAWEMLSAAMDQAFPGRYNPKTLKSIGQNIASSWQQSGHLQGKRNKTRSHPPAHLESTVYALVLSYLCGDRGEALFHSYWVELLDAPDHLVREQAREAARRGWLDYKSLGGVSEIEFPRLLPDSGTAIA